MNRTRLSVLGAVVAVMMVIVAINLTSAGKVSDDLIGTKVFPGLKAKLESVSQVTLAGNGGATTLVRSDDGWIVAEREHYPADFSKLSTLLVGLADATFLERKTAREENYAALGVDDAGSPGSESLLVAIDVGNETLRLLVGRESSGMTGTFVRFPDEPQVWLVSALGSPAAAPAAWIEPVVIDVDAASIQKVTFTQPGGDVLVAQRSYDNSLKVLDIPAGKELKYDTIGDSFARALVNLRALDVRKRAGPWGDAASAEFETGEGGPIVVYSRQLDGDYWIRIDAETKAVSGDESPTASLPNWEFRVSLQAYQSFTKTMNDIVMPQAEDT